MGQTLFKYISQQLKEVASPGERDAMSRILLEKLLGINYTKGYLLTPDELTQQEHSLIEQAIKRLKLFEPIQYVLGETEFNSHIFHLQPGVLIPRPETEELVNLAILNAQSIETPTIVDAGTGSGCIAISLSLALPNAHIHAFDISQTALNCARDNAKRLNAKVNFFQADMLSHSLHVTDGIDILISNPPYIMESEKKDMHPRVKDYEPPQALFVPDKDPLLYYSSLATWGEKALKPDGVIMAEINSHLAVETQGLFLEEGYRQVQIIQDQFGKPRIIQCKK